MDHRAEILAMFAAKAAPRPVRWTDERTSMGDFSGREWTLEIFDVPVQEQRSLHDQLWPVRQQIRQQYGVHLTLILHTPEATDRYYSWVRTEPHPPR